MFTGVLLGSYFIIEYDFQIGPMFYSSSDKGSSFINKSI